MQSSIYQGIAQRTYKTQNMGRFPSAPDKGQVTERHYHITSIQLILQPYSNEETACMRIKQVLMRCCCRRIDEDHKVV